MSFQPQKTDLVGQFVLGEAGLTAPAAWKTLRIGERVLMRHPALPVTEVVDLENRSVAWLLDHPLHVDRLAKNARIALPFAMRDASAIDAFESWLYAYGGRFACILNVAGAQRLYLDAGGTLAAVYDPARRRVGSTPTALNLENVVEYQQRMASAPPLKANHFYPAGLTAEDGVLRLLPSHYLDLASFRAVRHWPLAPIARVETREAPVHCWRIAELARETMFAASLQCRMVSGLSAGRDSRMIAGCARTMLDCVSFFTFDYKDPGKFADMHIALRLAKLGGMQHQVVSLLDPTPDMKADYLFRVGYTNNAGKACDFDDACRRQLDLNSALLTGYGGEVGRTFYYTSADPNQDVSSEALLKLMKLDNTERNIQAMGDWVAGLPKHADAHLILDLLYVEQRLGCWACPQFYGMAPFRTILTPLVQRGTFEAMLRLPLEYRLKQEMTDEVVRISWPQLLEIPYQVLTGYAGFLQKAKKKLRKLKGKLSGKAA